MSKLTRTSKFDFYPLTVLKQYISSYIIQLVCKFYDYCFCFRRWGEKDKDRSQSVYYSTKLRSSLVPRDSPQKWLDWVPQGAGFVHLLSIPVSGRNNNSLFQMKQLWKKKILLQWVCNNAQLFVLLTQRFAVLFKYLENITDLCYGNDCVHF